jgi:dsDNA-binding SOS-regulon protein
MKKSDKFVWTDEVDAALKDLKRMLSTAPVRAAPEDQEPMLLYMAATNRVVSIIIMVERKEEAHEYNIQRPVYYVSEVLTESKKRYPHY